MNQLISASVASIILLSHWIQPVSAACARGTTFNIGDVTGWNYDSTPYGYSPTDGPLVWHTLQNGLFQECALGTHQSPIDITTDSAMDEETQIRLGRNKVDWYNGDFDINFGIVPGSNNATYLLENLGTTMELSQLDVDDPLSGEKYESYSVLNGTKYHMKQVHFHSPSEHKINGITYPLEAHIVHQDPVTNRVFVLGILFEPNSATGAISDGFTDVFKLTSSLTNPGDSSAIHMSWTNLRILQAYSRKIQKWVYDGSFTTPPCTEGVTWLVLSEPLRVSFEDENTMRHVLKGNARFTQMKLGQPNVLSSTCARRPNQETFDLSPQIPLNHRKDF